ncbi:MAG TPA: hypothetical protein VFQ45_18475, partial [Longimicrobium sp.]|nr:hypothetical protein [Longimicrobium sp.]
MEWKKSLLAAAVLLGVLLLWSVLEGPVDRLRRWTSPRMNGRVVAALWGVMPLAWVWMEYLDPNGTVGGNVGLAVLCVALLLPLAATHLWQPPGPYPPRERRGVRVVTGLAAAAILALLPVIPEAWRMTPSLAVAALSAVAVLGRVPAYWPAWLPAAWREPDEPAAPPPPPP